MTLLLAAALAALPCITLPGGADRITAAALASAWPEVAAADGDAVIGFAPAPGVRRVFSGAELHRLAARFHVTGEVPPSLCVERAGGPLSDEQVRAAMSAAFPDAAIEIKDRYRGPAPEGELHFPRELLQPSGLWKGYVVYGPARRFSIWARVKVKTQVTRVVAVERLAAGKPVEAGQVKLETVEANPGPDQSAHRLEDVVGRLPKRSVEAGAPVPRFGLTEAPLVAKGDTVKVDVEMGGARLQLDAKAETEGRRGDTVQLTNPASGRRFSARVTGKGTAAAGAKAKEHL